MTRYFVAAGSDRTGPFTVEELRDGAASPPLDGDTLVWAQGMADWTRAGSVEALADVVRERAARPSTDPTTASPSTDAAGSSPPLPPLVGQGEEDFILLNPRLPRMAQAICAYALVVNPALLVLNNLSCLSFHHFEPAGAPAATLINVMTIAGTLVSLVTTAVLAYGGFLLRAARRRGVTVLKLGFIADLVTAALTVVVLVIIAVLVFSAPETPPDPATGSKQVAGDLVNWLLGATSLASVVWELVCLVWLLARGKRLPLT